MKYTKEYIAKVRLCSNLIEPPASDVIGELLDEIERLTAERDEWKADAERLAKECIYVDYNRGEYICVHCAGYQWSAATVEHSPDCPITLHRELEAKYGGEHV